MRIRSTHMRTTTCAEQFGSTLSTRNDGSKRSAETQTLESPWQHMSTIQSQVHHTIDLKSQCHIAYYIMNASKLISLFPVDFGVGVAIYLNAPLHQQSNSASTAVGSSGPRPLKWTHKSPLLSALGKLDITATARRSGTNELVTEVRRRVKKLDKVASAAAFVRARDLADVFPRAAAYFTDADDAAERALSVSSGQHFLQAAQLHQLLATCRLVKHTALVTPDHTTVPSLLQLLQDLLQRTDSPVLRKAGRQIEQWLGDLPPLSTAPPLGSAELQGSMSRYTLDWRPLSAAALRQQGATAARLLLSDEQREWVVGLADRVEKSIDSLAAANTNRRFSGVIRFLQGNKKAQ
jgi:hypothetical protein